MQNLEWLMLITMPLAHQGFLSVSGPDAQTFLQGQLTCDCRLLQNGSTTLAAHCSPKGRVISLFRLLKHQDGYWLNLPLDMIPIALAALKKYSVFFKVSISDVSTSLQAIGLVGETQGVPNTLCFSVSSHRHILINTATTEGPAWQWQLDDIRAGLPMIYPNTSERWLPHDLNLPALGAVSFEKGCYTGQEIIARMEYRGKPKYHLQYHTAANAVSGGEQYGEIVDSLVVADTCHYLAVEPRLSILEDKQ